MEQTEEWRVDRWGKQNKVNLRYRRGQANWMMVAEMIDFPTSNMELLKRIAAAMNALATAKDS